MKSLDIRTPHARYPAVIEENGIKGAGRFLRDVLKTKRLFVVTDENVHALFGETVRKSLADSGFDPVFHALRPGERSKSMKTLESVLGRMAREGVTRADAAVALGGGVVCDITGFAAAVYMRGIPFAAIPTTLLAQIDASIGGKTAVNLKEGKNLAGAFHQPAGVLIDPAALRTLPPGEWREGMAEMIKYACIADAGLFDRLSRGSHDLSESIHTCCDIKRRTVEQDERDKGLRMILNFGHTIGHALEARSRYRCSHGRAVAAGMAHITRRSEELGLTEKGTYRPLRELLRKNGLPHALPGGAEGLYEIMLRDKKRSQATVNLVLLKKIGECFLHPVTVDEMKAFL